MVDDATEEEHEDIVCVGTEVGDRFEHTSELKTTKYEQAMKAKCKPKWKKVAKWNIETLPDEML